MKKTVVITTKLEIDLEDYFGTVDEGWAEDFVADVKQALTEIGGVTVVTIKKKD